ncbi:MAG: PhoX family protein, partial [Myxococcales bacterium]|nr:PhoX family protein [Myxococcales bacterium]
MRITRRAFLRGLGGAAIAAGLPLSGLLRSSANALYGPLVADPAGLLDLPAGFSYVVVDRRFGIMSDGYRIPFYPDGMGVFSGPGGALILMRNHEIPITGISAGPYLPGQTPPREAYSATAYGAVTRVVVDPLTLAPISSNLVLTGTVRNCGGGETPYGWLSCEETGEPGHGYVFLCDPAAATVQRPQRIDGFGRFAHEGAAMDPLTEITYLTEDISSSPLYRFVPSRLGSPFRGELQAMRIVGMPNRNTSLMRVGEIVAVDWVPVADPSAALESTSAQAFAGGAAVIRRGEGIWFQGGSATFASTSGGTSGLGQIFRHDPGAGTLELLAEGADPAVLDMPDNLTVAPWGDVYIAEDGPRGNFMRILSPDGSISTFARNAASAGELAGPCFSPDGRVLFLNL